MRQHEASRTLVKSPPELWAECSDAASLARHLGAFGEIRITRLDPETAVAWEGENVRGTVRIEPAGWGTKVILTAEQPAEEVAPPVQEVTPVATQEPEPAIEGPEPPAPLAELVAVPELELELEPEPEPEPELEPEPDPVRRRRFARLRAFFRGPVPVEVPAEPDPTHVEAEPVVLAEPVAEPSAPVADAEEPVAGPEAPVAEPSEPVAEPVEPVAGATEAALAAALDSLGQAHHRPYSRA